MLPSSEYGALLKTNPNFPVGFPIQVQALSSRAGILNLEVMG
jgi:hypothetical protein